MNGRIEAIERAGHGPVVVLVHGFHGNAVGTRATRRCAGRGGLCRAGSFASGPRRESGGAGENLLGRDVEFGAVCEAVVSFVERVSAKVG
jgi:hypothetical protein